MENPRSEKVAVVDEVTAKLEASSAVIVTEYRGMTVGQLAALRRQLRPAGGEYKVYKNTLARFAGEGRHARPRRPAGRPERDHVRHR